MNPGKSMPTLLATALAGLLCLPAACGSPPRDPEVVTVEPRWDAATADHPPRTSRERSEAMLATFQTIGDLQSMTFFGDFDEAIRFQQQQLVQQFGAAGTAGPQQGRGGSMFAVRTGRDSGLVGRNYDNGDTQVLVGWFQPAQGYASVGLIPLTDLGFTADAPFDPNVAQHRRNLLYAPVMTIEGMNEMGLTITLASLGRRPVRPADDRQPRFLIHLVREILDQAATVNEAVAIAEKFSVFDNGRDLISHHIFLADPHSGSAVLEWQDGVMHLVKDAGDWQVVTNGAMLGVPIAERRQDCGRYDSLCGSLEQDAPPATWQDALAALTKVRQHNRAYDLDGRRSRVSTQWSVVFDTGRREVLLRLAADDSRVYRLTIKHRT